MTRQKVYLETSVISYLTARPRTDVIKLAKQTGYTEVDMTTPEELWGK